MKCLRRISSSVDRALTSFYRAGGRLLARRPWAVILVCAVITLACCAGFVRFSVEEDAEKLYTPQDAPSFEDKAYVDANYPSDELSVKVLSLDKAQNGGNVLTKQHLLEHLRAHQLITTQTVGTNGRTYNWTDLCSRPTNASACKIDSVLVFWGYDAARIEADDNLITTVNNKSVVGPNGRTPNLNWVLGGVQRDQAGNVVRAEVLQSVYYAKTDPSMSPSELDNAPEVKYQERIVEVAYDEWESPILAQFVSCDAAVGRESTKAINRDVMRLTVGYILLIVYTFIVLWRNSWAYQKTHLTLASMLSIGMGIATCFGLLSGLGVKFNFVCQVLPFLLVGVGVDNTFVIVSNYFDQDPDAPIEHRLGEAMGLAGSSITVSCMTNVIAFAVGTYTSLEALLSFSIYASVGVLLVFLYQVTVFPALLALDARRELRKRLGLGGCCGCLPPGPCVRDPAQEAYEVGANGWSLETNVYKHDDHGDADGGAAVAGSLELQQPRPEPVFVRSSSARSGASGSGGGASMTARASAGDLTAKVSVSLPSPGKEAQQHPQQQQQQRLHKGTTGLLRDFTTPVIMPVCGQRTFHPHDDQLSTKLVARWLPAVSLNTFGKIGVVILECVFLGFAIYGCTKVYMDFNFRELFVPEGNWLHEAFAVEDRYFGGEKVPISAFTRATVDGRDYYYYQDQLQALSDALANDPYITDTPAVSSWYVSFSRWLATPGSATAAELVDGRAPNATVWNTWLRTWLDTDGRSFSESLLFNSSGVLVGSRISAFTKDVKDGAWAVRAVDSTRATVEAAAPGLNPIAFGYSFTFWDGFRTIAMSTVVNVIIAASAVFLVTLLLLADIVASVMVGTMVVLCDVGVFGFMHYAGLQFNSVTCIVLVLAVGIAVDYSAHVMRAFLVSTGTRQERAHKALIEIGGAVWNGAITTFLAVVTMSAAEHYIFTTIFQMFSVLILLAVWHGLVLLPVLLSWIGPASYRDGDGERPTSMTPVEKV